ncbi:MAG: hypothetical protein IIZ80_02195 [Erysipelotrichaceae bacterium]|nr:hypothetical protein [Erysipelotrichaceae bacterium]
MAEKKEINNLELETISAGSDGTPEGSWTYGLVHDIVHYNDSSCLALYNAPDGDVLYKDDGKPIGWHNGESILIQPSSRTGSWIRANYNGKIGWTNANHIWY